MATRQDEKIASIEGWISNQKGGLNSSISRKTKS